MNRYDRSKDRPLVIPFVLRVALVVAGIAACQSVARAVELRSPGGDVVVRFDVKDVGDLKACPVYGVTYKRRPILVDSRLGLQIDKAPALDRDFTIVAATGIVHNEVWKPLYGERSEVRDRYAEMSVTLEDAQTPPRRLGLKFRAYDEGAAFCYVFPEQATTKEMTVTAEETRFRFSGNHTAWATYSAQGKYEAVPLDAIKPGCERPLTVEVADDCYAAIAEARLVDFARMKLQPIKGGGEPNTLQAMLGGQALVTAPYTTPRRVILLGNSPGQLLERNYLLLNLNDSCAIDDTSWIKPGKVIRETTLSTIGGKACVDFAVERGLQYIELDAGWYGPESRDDSDATKVARPDLDLPDLIRYAKEKGIGVILYVNRRALERQREQAFALYDYWGVAGVKFGFVNVGPQTWTAWVNEGVRRAADHHLMVDVHDEFRPTGYGRTYPNLMTVEGVRGNEEFPDAAHNATLPFTRYLAGPADYTICVFDARLKNSRAHQLALSVIYYSPWQFVFWYDKPAAYHGEPEIEFLKQVPTVWDDTRVVQGKIGQYATVARRSGDAWFVGSITNGERRQLEIPLAFLDPAKQYVAEVYADGQPEGGALTKVGIATLKVDSQTVLKADLAANGGQAVRIVPAKPAP